MKKSKPKTRAWMKNHPLEGDGLVTGFYNFLYKRNTKTMKACKDVMIPDTIVFDHNFPRGWYTSDRKSKEILKKQGKELDAASIYNAFCKTPDNVGIVASYMSSYETEDLDGSGETEPVTSVEFFNKEGLEEFVGRKVKREGILQKFLVPKGLRNSVIQAVWSPRVCFVQRRTNVNSIKDKLQSDKDPYSCAVTYEGPSHFSEEGTCAAHTTAEIKNICSSIVQHFFSTEHKYITRMVLYFKVDAKDQVWLLWCGSLRVSDRDQPSQMPLNLAPRFSSPEYDARSPRNEDTALRDVDSKHYHMSNDSLFFMNFVKKTGRHSDDESTGGTPRLRQTGKGDGSGNQGSPGAAANRNAKSEKDGDDKDRSDWYMVPGIQEQYREICMDREQVLSHIDDIFYEAYGHFLRHEPGAFVFEVDRKIAQVLGVDVLQEMMQSLKIEHSIPTDDSSAADEELCYAIAAGHGHGPITKLGDAASRWIHSHYSKKESALKEEAAAVPVTSAGQEEEEEEVSPTKREEPETSTPPPEPEEPVEAEE